MTWKKIGKLIGKAAPLLGSVVAGPAGGIAGKVISEALGVENKPDEVEQALRDDPEAFIKIQQAEYSNAEKLAAIAAGDRADARKNHKNNPMPSIICIALTLMVAALCYLVFYAKVPEANEELAYLLFGALIAKWGDSIAYWVGTTRGSAEKTGLLKQNL